MKHTLGGLLERHKLGPLGDLVHGLLLGGGGSEDLDLEAGDGLVVDRLALRAGDAPAQVLRQVLVDGLLGEIGDLALRVGVDEGAGEGHAHGDGDVLLGHARLGEDSGGADQILVEGPGGGV